ncbi:YfcC family protein [Wenzhouxiangella marina]|uniref:C4-dicarboxylate anaerobic carrier-like protein n=1 Tax=Wenzhouxiangella marina TaxID=1579979 RepID=A0A0K0XVY3_9GAMM|nr:TIGR00366 family protein [Wenzhouxiangella marina]AKS41776.1 C4-dicarboxylate anaerobic carrier-like protein [Wenzhouxiangella marina]MBB6086462.1 putative ion transporter superfamily protein YfcC [Wenzhouxiangella marina]
MSEAKSFQVPHTLVLMFAMMGLALILTWVLPSGQFETVTNDHGREVVVPGTFAVVEEAPTLTPLALFTSVPRAMADAQGIIFFVLLIGGALAVIRETGAIEAFLGSVLKTFGENYTLLIFFGIGCFAFASATLGIAEEYIPLAGILIALCRAMKLDTVAAIGIMVVGYGVGYGATLMNPFTLIIAQEVAELEPMSGLWFRLLILPFFLAIGIHHVWAYARRVRADHAASLVHGIESAQAPEEEEMPPMTAKRMWVLLASLGALALLVYGIMAHGWYLTELGAVFIGLSIVVALISRMSPDTLAISFSKGAAELAGTAILIGFARSIGLILEDGMVIHTIVNGLASPLINLPSEASAVGMLGIQSLMNILVSSGSGQAYLTMPLMAPIGDLVGISRQISVLAFQFGDGFMNMIVPTNPVLMGILGLAGIPYDRWLRFIFPLILKLLAAAAICMVVAVQIGYQ